MNYYDKKEAEAVEIILNSHYDSMKVSGQKFTLTHLLMHELLFFFLTNIAQARFSNEVDSFMYRSFLEKNNFIYRSRFKKFVDPFFVEGFLKRLAFRTFDLIGIVFWGRIKRVYLGEVSLKFSDLIFLILKKGALPSRLNRPVINLSALDQQYLILKEASRQLLRLIEAGSEVERDYFRNLEKFVASCRAWNIEDSIVADNRSVVLFGSTGGMSNRLLAYSASAQGWPSVGVLHGDECGSNTLLSWAVDDFSCADSLIGYGPKGLFAMKKARQKMFGNAEDDFVYIESCASPCRGDLVEEKLKALPSGQNKGLLVASRVRDLGVINPGLYRSPVEYRKLKRRLSEIEGLSIKCHPKGNDPHEVFPEERQVKGNLTEQIVNYDYLIIDNLLSTAFFQIIQSKKPIFVLDLPQAMRFLTKEASDALDGRLISVDISADSSISKQILEGLERYKSNLKTSQEFVSNYLLSEQNPYKDKDRASVVIEEVFRVL